MPTLQEINAAALERARRSNTPEVQRIQAQLVAAQKDAALHASLEPGELREIVETDETGRRIRRFVGDPGAAWAPFKYSTQRVTGINSKFK